MRDNIKTHMRSNGSPGGPALTTHRGLRRNRFARLGEYDFNVIRGALRGGVTRETMESAVARSGDNRASGTQCKAKSIGRGVHGQVRACQ
jgi:hypothetical protein